MSIDVNNGRKLFPDVTKAFLILLVVLGHIIGLYYKNNMNLYWNNPIITFIYSFHMPLFIAMSGFFCGMSNIVSFLTFVQKKAGRLLFPIILGLLLSVFFDFVFDSISGGNIIFVIYKYLTRYWFLNCLFIFSLLIGFCRTRRKIVLLFFVVVMSLLVLFYEYLPKIVFKDWQIVRLFPIYIVSYFLGCKHLKIELFFQKKVYSVTLFCTFVWLILINYWGINVLLYPCIVRILVGFVGSISMIGYIYICYCFLREKRWLSAVAHIGKNSLGIYIIHIPIFKILPSINNWFYIVIISLMLLFLTSLITDCCRRLKIGQLLLGER